MGTIERLHQHGLDSGLALLNNTSLPLTFWRYAFAAAVFTYNRTPIDILVNDSPFQKLFHKSPNIRDLHVFGCLVYPNLRPFNWLSPHIFIGYLDNTNGYLCYDPIKMKTITSRDVVFLENDFTENDKLSGSPKSFPDKSEDPTLNVSRPRVVSDNSWSTSTLASSPGVPQSSQSSQYSQPSQPSQPLESIPAVQQVVLDRTVHAMMTRTKVGTRCPNPKYALQISAMQSLPRNVKMALDSP